jgi:hypothetical protein
VAIKLRIRNLKTREVGVVDFATEPDAAVWLKARPAFVEVLGVAGQISVPMDLQDRLKAIVRPLDEDERLAVRELELAIDKEDLERQTEARKREIEAAQKHAESMRTGDPDRLMEIHWRFDKGMNLTDPVDPRAIPDAARDAVLAWIAERNAWVAGRGQCVGECTLKVWPGKMPAGSEERVKEGRFVPVSAEEKK